MSEPITIVVPCYGEAERLDQGAFERFAHAHPEVHFLFVDDGSVDDTLAVLQGLAPRCPGAEVLPLSPNQGKAEAVRRGVLRALDTPSWAVGFWDADLAIPLEEILSFAAILEQRPEAELVMGSRVRMLGWDSRRDWRRHYFGRVAATAVSVMLDLEVYDTQCGAKLFRAGPRWRAIFAEPFLTRWIFDVELIARWLLAASPTEREEVERHLLEEPLRQWTDVPGSKLQPRDFILAPVELARIWWTYGRRL